MKIRPVGAELFGADGWTDEQTDMMKLNSSFSHFAIALKNANTHPKWIPPQIQ